MRFIRVYDRDTQTLKTFHKSAFKLATVNKGVISTYFISGLKDPQGNQIQEVFQYRVPDTLTLQQAQEFIDRVFNSEANIIDIERCFSIGDSKFKYIYQNTTLQFASNHIVQSRTVDYAGLLPQELHNHPELEKYKDHYVIITKDGKAMVTGCRKTKQKPSFLLALLNRSKAFYKVKGYSIIKVCNLLQ